MLLSYVGRAVLAIGLLGVIWGGFIAPVEVNNGWVFEERALVERLTPCGSVFDVLRGNISENIDSRFMQNECTKVARADTVFGIGLFAVVMAAGLMMVLSSKHKPLIGMRDVRSLPTEESFSGRQEAHARRARELSGKRDR